MDVPVPPRPKLVRMVAAVVVGFGVGTGLVSGTTALPVVRAVPSTAVGGAGVVAGGALYRFGPAAVDGD